MPGERVQTGTGVIVNGHFFMFDVGDGVVRSAVLTKKLCYKTNRFPTTSGISRS